MVSFGRAPFCLSLRAKTVQRLHFHLFDDGDMGDLPLGQLHFLSYLSTHSDHADFFHAGVGPQVTCPC